MNDSSFPTTLFYFFPFLFIGMWLLITTILSFLSEWFWLCREFPDTEERGRLLGSYRASTAWMGIGVNMRGILTIEAYERGLRLKFMRVFGPFNKPAFVQWKDIQIERKVSFFLKGATFTFGTGDASIKMGIEEDLTNNIWRAAGNLWPEKGTPPGPLPKTDIFKLVFRKWLFRTAFASVFFILAPRIAWPDRPNSFPPVLVAILFPAIVFGIGCLYEYSKKAEDQKRSRN